MQLQWSLLALTLLSTLSLGQKNGYDPDWWEPDIVIRKKDPYDQIASDFGQPEGKYNWNNDQFTLMRRQQKTCNDCTENGKHVAIEDMTLFVDDKEYFVKAVAYNPVPLGYKSMQWDGSGGGGLCSQKRTPYDVKDFKSACWDSDYFDGGSDDPTRDPPGPPGGWFNGLWARDFPILVEAGTNTIRIYNTNPTTRKYTQEVLDGKQTSIDGDIVEPPMGNDHVPFMDAALSAGLMVIYPLLGDRDMINTLTQNAYERYLKNQIDEIGNHKALLMYTVGNELDLQQHPTMAEKVNHYMDFARNYSMQKWGRKIPVTHPVRDDPSSYPEVYALLKVDVFTANSGYRGIGFWELWDGPKGLGQQSKLHGIPNLIGEMGWHQVNNSETKDNPGWFNMQWKDLIQKGVPQHCIGGTFFEYLDEFYSKGNAMEQSMGMVTTRVSSIDEPLPPDQHSRTSPGIPTSAGWDSEGTGVGPSLSDGPINTKLPSLSGSLGDQAVTGASVHMGLCYVLLPLSILFLLDQ